MISASANRKVRYCFGMSIKLCKVAFSSPVNRVSSPVIRFLSPIPPGVNLHSTRNPSTLLVTAQLKSNYLHSASVQEFRSTPSNVRHRITRSNRVEAEEALAEYLNSTSGLVFSDADHISKNCPLFIQKLIPQGDKSDSLKKSLRKYLRYNPINEFEPFFESLGLKPSEYSALLPRDHYFLRDEPLLVHNYHVLCNYGFPRTNMGKMLKQAREIFNYGPGVIESKLRAYTLLGLGRGTVTKMVICSPSLLVGEVDKYCVEVLNKFKKLGFENDWTLKNLFVEELYDWKQMAETLNFLESLGYSEQNLLDFMKKALLKDSEGNIVPVIKELVRIGFDRNTIFSLFMKSPEMFSPQGAKNLICAIKILQKIGFQFDFLETFISENVNSLCLSSLKSLVSVSSKQKMKKEEIFQLLTKNPEKFLTLFEELNTMSKKQPVAGDVTRDMDKKAFLLRLGYLEDTEEMKIASRVFRGKGDELEERFNCLIESGMDFNGAKTLVRNAPQVLNQSKDVIQKKIDCLRYNLGYPVDSLVMFPAFLGYSLDRINRRIAMFTWLRDRGAVKTTLSISSLLVCSEQRFMKYFVLLHPDGLAHWNLLCS